MRFAGVATAWAQQPERKRGIPLPWGFETGSLSDVVLLIEIGSLGMKNRFDNLFFNMEYECLIGELYGIVCEDIENDKQEY